MIEDRIRPVALCLDQAIERLNFGSFMFVLGGRFDKAVSHRINLDCESLELAAVGLSASMISVTAAHCSR